MKRNQNGKFMLRDLPEQKLAAALSCLLFFLFLPLHADQTTEVLPQVYEIGAGANFQYRLQERLIEAMPGDVIQLGAGRFDLTHPLDVVGDNVTIRGAGSKKTILAFSKQITGSHGIQAYGDNFVIEGLQVVNTSGNAIKVLGARNVVFRDVHVEWTGEAKSTNGAYGLYPVQCENVLIDGCTAIGASDAGIYVGQCKNVVVRNSHAERNVAGIEIENTVGADVYGNKATNNTGGILVFDLPGLQVKEGRNVRVFRNQVFANNHPNFAAPGNAVAGVPPGTGLMIMATDRVEAFENTITDNQTSSISIISYLLTGKKIKDKEFDPIPEAISVYRNTISGGGTKPSGEIGKLLGPILGSRFPDIMFDGVYDQSKLVDGKLPPDLEHYVAENGSATFVNFNLPTLSPENIANGKYRPELETTRYRGKRAPLPAIVLPEHDPEGSTSNPAVLVYRNAPKQLSEYGLFHGNGSTQEPRSDVIPYDLNTTLFSDYAKKRRFIKLPEGTAVQFRENGVFEFPEGTVIAKTFSYPHDMTDLSQGETLLETRIELKKEGQWFGFSYLWNDEQTEATLALGGRELDVTWIHSDGEKKRIKYQVPNANQCISCHSENGQFVPIGPEAENLNRSFNFSTGTHNQLEYLAERQLLSGLPSLEEVHAMPRIDDEQSGSDSVRVRARAWLDVNCAHCHNPTGSARTSGLDLRREQSNPVKFGVWKVPVAAGHGSGGHDYDIVPGKPDESILVHRLESDDPSIMMPNVARTLVPVEATQLIRDWIETMKDDSDKK